MEENCTFDLIKLNTPEQSYLHSFLNFIPLRNLIRKGLFSERKDLEESMAILHGIKSYFMGGFQDSLIDANNINTTVYIYGDGLTPKTGAILKYFTSWRVVSFLNGNNEFKNIHKENNSFVNYLGDPTLYKLTNLYKIIIIKMNASLRLEKILEKVNCPEIYVIELAYSDGQTYSKRTYDMCNLDTKILSPKKYVKIWYHV